MSDKIIYGNPPHLPITLKPERYYRELEQASYALGKLQIAHKKIANSDHLIKPLLTREASLSSKIEGTITDSKDVFVLDATGKSPKEDTPVVANYRKALKLASEFNKTEGLSNTKIRQIHHVLLEGTHHKGELGKYREKDAWIGNNETTPIEEALYVTPHFSQIDSRMENLLSYINGEDESPLVKTAIFHYMFEAIHPFEDGNGRIGRMLIPALLNYQGVLSEPVLYTSQYFEKNKELYKNKLRETDKTRDLNAWTCFFLESIVKQSEISVSLVDAMLDLNGELQNSYGSSQSPNIRRIVDYIFENPVFTASEVTANLSINRNTTKTLIEALLKDKVIEIYTEFKGRKGATVYIYTDLLRLIMS
ncbi:MAG: Fic family protein [Candidatus Saccharibacteria bacterium]|nr:Fic family protein [Candidatus Saccharibacteria bacterium]